MRKRMTAALIAFCPSGDRAKKWVRYLEEKATASVAIAPESMTRNSVQPNRNEIMGP